MTHNTDCTSLPYVVSYMHMFIYIEARSYQSFIVCNWSGFGGWPGSMQLKPIIFHTQPHPHNITLQTNKLGWNTRVQQLLGKDKNCGLTSKTLCPLLTVAASWCSKSNRPNSLFDPCLGKSSVLPSLVWISLCLCRPPPPPHYTAIAISWHSNRLTCFSEAAVLVEKNIAAHLSVVPAGIPAEFFYKVQPFALKLKMRGRICCARLSPFGGWGVGERMLLPSITGPWEILWEMAQDLSRPGRVGLGELPPGPGRQMLFQSFPRSIHKEQSSQAVNGKNINWEEH